MDGRTDRPKSRTTCQTIRINLAGKIIFILYKMKPRICVKSQDRYATQLLGVKDNNWTIWIKSFRLVRKRVKENTIKADVYQTDSVIFVCPIVRDSGQPKRQRQYLCLLILLLISFVQMIHIGINAISWICNFY